MRAGAVGKQSWTANEIGGAGSGIAMHCDAITVEVTV